MDRDWLKLARDAYSNSTSYVDANYRRQWENNLRAFQSRHALDSKYHSESYKHRSKLFRPKTRSVIRKNEAASAAAFFANTDVISTEAQNSDDPQQVAAASVLKELIEYRLTHSIPWFLTVQGAIQDAQTIGVVCSAQTWKYRQETVNGKVEVMEDRPDVEIFPVENLRIDPSADWRNPITSSPYVIRLIPMYVCDVQEMMDAQDPKTGAPKWKHLAEDQIRAAQKQNTDTTRQTREDERMDPDQSARSNTQFDIVWVHENFIKQSGKLYVYYTMGTEQLLTDPKPIKEVYRHGIIPIVLGFCVIETHKIYPSGLTQLAESLQKEANEVVNQRLDNVKLVLNKRWIVKRGANADIASLTRNVAGGVTLANDINDIKEISFPDVTQSSYAEQDRINVDYDELVGNFSTGTVQSNRKLNETVRGMGMISQSSNMLVEYLIRIFTETWMMPVLYQLVKLEQHYETDEVVLAVAASKAQLFQKFGMDKVTDDLLNHELTLNVSVGIGATDPMMKLQKLIQGVESYAKISATAPENLNLVEIGKEIFGAIGYRDGKRFMVEGQDPRTLMKKIAQLQMQLKNKQMDAQTKLGIAHLKSDTDITIAAGQHAAQEAHAQAQAEQQAEQAQQAQAAQAQQQDQGQNPQFKQMAMKSLQEGVLHGN